MPDQIGYEYFDEDGNPVDPAELGDYEVVDDEAVETPVPAAAAVEPAPQAAPEATPPAAPRIPKALFALGAAVVLGIGGVVVYGMHSIGQQNAVEDVQAAISSKSVAVSSAVESKKAEVVSAKGEYLVGQKCPVRAVEGAQWADAGDPLPEYQLQAVGSTQLPAGFRERVKKKAAGEPREVVLIQLNDAQFGVYVSGATADTQNGRNTWWKALIGTSGDEPAVLGDGQGTGRDKDMSGACKSIPEGDYLVMDDGATEAPAAPTHLLGLKPEADSDGVVYGVSEDGEQLLKLRIAQTPAEAREAHAEGGDASASSSSAVPGK